MKTYRGDVQNEQGIDPPPHSNRRDGLWWKV